ncbi:MAG: transposase [Burkholderiales bacterium]|nr:transposase [Burkholderiales bacterium]
MRVKDRHAEWLTAMAGEVNLVWNYCNELQMRVFERERKLLSGFDFWPYLKGSTRGDCALHLPVQAVQETAERYATNRSTHKRVRLAWRKSGGSRRSLGWVPFKVRTIKYAHGQVYFAGRWLSVWDSWGLGDYELRAGSFSEDARGRWYLNVSVRVPLAPRAAPDARSAIGIDLGLKDLAALSDGDKVAAERFYRDLQPALASAQRADKKKRVAAIHAKIANRRRDFLHKLTTALARRYAAVCVGDVDAAALVRGPHAKSVMDAGWSAMRTMLRYKCDDAGAWFVKVPEAGTTRNCSSCGAHTGPQGELGLSIREWKCSACGTHHDRDINAARNILARGLAILEQQFSAAGEAKAGEAAMNELATHVAGGVGHGPLVAGSSAL